MREREMVLALLAAAALVCLVWRLYQLKKQLRREQEENRRLREILQMGGQAVQNDLKRLRSLRHDLRHYLLAAGDAPRDAAALGERLADDLSAPVAGDGVLSVLEGHYRARAQALGFQADLHILPPEGWEEGLPDLCLVVSNLLENSVEALEREGGGWLRARSMSTPGYFSLVVGNTCTRPLRTLNGRYLSSKTPGRLGIGLETVREVAQRYGGQAEFTVEDGEFRASVFLPRPKAQPAGASAPQPVPAMKQ